MKPSTDANMAFIVIKLKTNLLLSCTGRPVVRVSTRIHNAFVEEDDDDV